MLIDLLLGGTSNILQVVVYLLSSLTIIFLIMPVHEFAHGFMANRLGDPTPRYQGRLTLNPLAHIDYRGALMIILFGFGWANPVQVNPMNFRNPKKGMVLTALAGPTSNVICAFFAQFLAALFLKILPSGILSLILYFLFHYIALINMNLALFNFIPIPPLDGAKILTAVLPDRIYFKIMQYERYIFLLVILLSFSGAFDWISSLSYGTCYLFDLLFGLILF